MARPRKKKNPAEDEMVEETVVENELRADALEDDESVLNSTDSIQIDDVNDTEVVPDPSDDAERSGEGKEDRDEGDGEEESDEENEDEESPSGMQLPMAAIVEAVLFAAREPLKPAQIARAVGKRVRQDAVREAIAELNVQYLETGRAFEIAEISGKYQLMSRPEFSEHIMRIYPKKDLADKDAKVQRLTPAMMDTLAIIAYKQPVMRSEIEHIRGVSCSNALRALIERGTVREIGRRADLVGKPGVYGTTERFLAEFGLGSIDELPMRNEFVDPGDPPPVEMAVLEEGETVQSEEGDEDASNESNTPAQEENGESALNGDERELLETSESSEAELNDESQELPEDESEFSDEDEDADSDDDEEIEEYKYIEEDDEEDDDVDDEEDDDDSDEEDGEDE